MTEVDPDPYEPAENQGQSVFGGPAVPEAGDPTEGGKRGQIGNAPSIAADEPDDGGPPIPPGGGHVAEESTASPVPDPGPDA